MRTFRLTRVAEREVASLLDHSQTRFGEAAADRYQALLLTAFSLLRRDPLNVATHAIEGRPQDRRFHLRSVQQTRPKSVKSPRHIIIFRVDGETVVVLRVLHERRDFERHLR